MNKAIEFLKAHGYAVNSDLNYCTNGGINFYVGHAKGQSAAAAFIEDESVYMIDKPCLREMSAAAKTAGVMYTTLYTNYGMELHSQHEQSKDVGFNAIIKVFTHATLH
jgi:hypothetical protein